MSMFAIAGAQSGTTIADEAPLPRHRVIILSDIENEPDDTQSFVRLFLYSNQIDIEAIVATTSTHMKNGVHPESIRRIIAGYGQVRANLLKREAGPAA